MYNIFFNKGKQIELLFINKYLKNYNLASSIQDREQHWDVEGICELISSDILKFDIKGLKKINRYDKKIQDEDAWVELISVNGKKGWLYGLSDFIVFERLNNWLIVKREELLKLTLNKLKENNFKTGKGRYMLYTRKNRKDKITLIPFFDIQTLQNNIILTKND